LNKQVWLYREENPGSLEFGLYSKEVECIKRKIQGQNVEYYSHSFRKAVSQMEVDNRPQLGQTFLITSQKILQCILHLHCGPGPESQEVRHNQTLAQPAHYDCHTEPCSNGCRVSDTITM
jgi:hypothetical protein